MSNISNLINSCKFSGRLFFYSKEEEKEEDQFKQFLQVFINRYNLYQIIQK